jgi:mannitol-1-phosphate/altronate dehydrogenase
MDISHVHDAAMHPVLGPHLEKLMQGYARIVEKSYPISGKNALLYAKEFISRMKNISDTNKRICINDTIKLRDRAVPIAISQYYRNSSDSFKNDFALSWACVFRYLTPKKKSGKHFMGITEGGNLNEINDPNTAIPEILYNSFDSTAGERKKKLMRILSDTELWSTKGDKKKINLSKNHDLTQRIIHFYESLLNGKTITELLVGTVARAKAGNYPALY